MRILLTGHQGYLGTVMAPILTAAGRAGHRIIANVLGHVRARAAARA